jgi:hypothetical protein
MKSKSLVIAFADETGAMAAMVISALLLLLSGLRAKGPWPVVTPALGVKGARRNICVPASIMVSGRSAGARTSRKS